MKKRSALFWAIILALTLSACSSLGYSDGTAAIVTNQGETVTMTSEELMAVYDHNEASFHKRYQCAQIQFTGTIRLIQCDPAALTGPVGMEGGPREIIWITFEEGWCLALSAHDPAYDLSCFSPGDRVHVTSSICGPLRELMHTQGPCSGRWAVWLAGDDIPLRALGLGSGVFCSSVRTVIQPVELFPSLPPGPWC